MSQNPPPNQTSHHHHHHHLHLHKKQTTTTLPDFLLTALSLFLLVSSPSKPLSLPHHHPRRFLKLPTMSLANPNPNPNRRFTTPQSLSDWLKPRLPTDSFASWGVKPGTKNVHNLFLELSEGETTLVDDDSAPPVRTLDVVIVRIIGSNNRILIESCQELSDGSVRDRNRPLSEKMKPGENPEAAAARAIREELGSVIGGGDGGVRIVQDSYVNENGENDIEGSDNASKDLHLATSSRDEPEERERSGNDLVKEDSPASPLIRMLEERERSGNDLDKEDSPASPLFRPPTFLPNNPLHPPAYDTFQIDSFKLMELLGPEKVNPNDVKLIKEKLFGYSTFWVTKEEPFGDLGEGILFLGNLRGKSEEVFAKLQSQLTELMGDKYNLFMVEEPNSEGLDPRGGPRVSFGMLRKEVSEPGPTTLWQYVIALLLFLFTIGSSVELGIASQINRLPPEVVKYFTDPNAVEPPDMQLLLPFVESALPLAYGVLGVQLFHEVGHFLAAFPKKVKLSIPYFIPNITLGSFGAITQFKSVLPDRRTMVDISLAGPFAGAALSFSMFAVGLLLSSNPDAAGDLVQVPGMLFQGSLLLGLISRATLGYAAMHAATVWVHPLVIAGWCGLTTSAFNMLPLGCLDGGRAVQGAFGKDALTGFGFTTYALLGLGALGGPLSLPWGLYVLICQRTPEKPCLDDVTDVGGWRRAILTVAIVLVMLTLLPVWDELAEELGIGLVSTF